MQGNRSESELERALRRELHARGLRFRKHFAPVPGVRCRPDTVFTRRRVAVFVDGCFWHRCPQHGSQPKANSAWWQEKLDLNVKRVRRNDSQLAEQGWTVVRLWEHEPLQLMKERILEALQASEDGCRTRPSDS